ncbi:HAMP domain-containing histidine kinase [bacterium]|nr:HAMP domain-containing histidine kinase [bacterium]
MSLRARLTLFIGVIVAVAVGVVATFAYTSARDEAFDEADALLTRRAVGVAFLASVGPEFEGFGGRDRLTGPGAGGGPGGLIRDDLVIQVVDADGTVIGTSGGAVLPTAGAAAAAASGDQRFFSDVTVEGFHFRVLTVAIGEGRSVQLASDVTATDEALTGLRSRLLLVGALGVLVAAAGAWLVAGRVLTPVRRLTLAAERVAETGRFDERIEVTRSDELGRMAAAFTTMLERLDASKRQQKRLVADAGHELRTPLTSLRTNIEVLGRVANLSESDRQEILTDAGIEVEELSALVEELVALAAADEAPESGTMIPVRLDDLVREAVGRASRRTAREITIEAQPITVTGNPAALRRAVDNLLDNADKWGPPGTPIDVTVIGSRVVVRDHGPGIDLADRDKVFDRFFRSESARSKPGSGLGLSIVRTIVTAHGGEVSVSEAPGGGAIVAFELPGSA